MVGMEARRFRDPSCGSDGKAREGEGVCRSWRRWQRWGGEGGGEGGRDIAVWSRQSFVAAAATAELRRDPTASRLWVVVGGAVAGDGRRENGRRARAVAARTTTWAPASGRLGASNA